MLWLTVKVHMQSHMHACTNACSYGLIVMLLVQHPTCDGASFMCTYTFESCLCSVLVLSNFLYKRDTDITDAGLVSLAGQHRSLGQSKKTCPLFEVHDPLCDTSSVI